MAHCRGGQTATEEQSALCWAPVHLSIRRLLPECLQMTSRGRATTEIQTESRVLCLFAIFFLPLVLTTFVKNKWINKYCYWLTLAKSEQFRRESRWALVSGGQHRNTHTHRLNTRRETFHGADVWQLFASSHSRRFNTKSQWLNVGWRPTATGSRTEWLTAPWLTVPLNGTGRKENCYFTWPGVVGPKGCTFELHLGSNWNRLPEGATCLKMQITTQIKVACPAWEPYYGENSRKVTWTYLESCWGVQKVPLFLKPWCWLGALKAKPKSLSSALILVTLPSN